MLRHVLTIILLVTSLAATLSPSFAAQERENHPTDLAAMPVPPHELPEPGYQFARGGYLSAADVQYLVRQRFPSESDAISTVFEGASWEQGYTATFVLLSDRASFELASVTTTVHAFESPDGAELMEAAMTSSRPANAEDRDPVVVDATTWRVATSQDDRLMTVVRSDRFLLELVSTDRERTPDEDEHGALVMQTLDRIGTVADDGGSGLSHHMVLAEDTRLVPLSIAPESPLVHQWYRVMDGTVIPVAGELETPETGDLAASFRDVAVARQTAELSRQSWVTVGLIVADFDASASATAFAENGVLRDPLDIFAASEDVEPAQSGTQGVRIEAISGDSRISSPYSGFRATVRSDSTVAQLTVRAMGEVLVDQDAVEAWALLQRDCVANGACDDVPLEDALRVPVPGTPLADQVLNGEYISPVGGWSVTYDTEVWRVADMFAEGGYDYLYLRSERMDATFETVVDHQGEPEQCVLNELDRLREIEDRAAITIGSADEGEQPGGLESGHAWVVYTVEPLEESRAEEEYTIRMDCYTVSEGSTSLVVQVRAPRADWTNVAPLGEALRSQIEIDGNPMSGMTGGPLATVPTTRSDVMIDRRLWVGIAA